MNSTGDQVSWNKVQPLCSVEHNHGALLNWKILDDLHQYLHDCINDNVNNRLAAGYPIYERHELNRHLNYFKHVGKDTCSNRRTLSKQKQKPIYHIKSKNSPFILQSVQNKQVWDHKQYVTLTLQFSRARNQFPVASATKY